MGDAQYWVRSLRYHSYHNVLREPDTFYAVDSVEDLETVTANGVAIRDDPPPTAVRAEPELPPPGETLGKHILKPRAQYMRRDMTPKS